MKEPLNLGLQKVSETFGRKINNIELSSSEFGVI